jgi:hypothetical protein
MMAVSVERAVRAAGLTGEEVDLVGRAYALAMAPRIDALDDDHHPAYLHPGRSVLLLLRDVGPLPGETLAAAAAHETVDEGMRVTAAVLRADLGEGVAGLVASLPLPGDARLAEILVALEEEARLAALAERLDQVRHAHLRSDVGWRAAHDEVEAVWLPVAERTHARLADRFRHWHRAFGRRRLR